MARVIVIGAGVGGMAAALRLKVKGHQVTILEQADTYGGKLGTFSRDGFTFDTGPSLFTLPAVYRDLFLKTGRQSLEEAIGLSEVEPGFGYRWADGTTLDMPGVGIGPCADALGDALGGRTSEEWRALMARAADIWQVTRRPFLESPLTGMGDLLPLARNTKHVRTVAPWSTLRRTGEKHLSDPRARTLLDRYATYTGSDPRRAPTALLTIPYVEQLFGAWHIPGGLRRLGDELARRCEERKVELRLNADVSRILTEAGAVSGVELADAERIAADIVVANADASHVYADLLGETAKDQVKRLSKATPSLSGFVILAAVKGTTPGIRHHNVWFPADYDDEFDSVFGVGRRRGEGARPVPDPTIYACVPQDPLMSPEGHESWFILINAPRHGTGPKEVDWSAPGLAASYADQVLETLARRGCDIRDRVLWREVRTPADLERLTRAPGGSIYGTSSNGARAAFLRPTNQSPIPGLFLVGGSSHPGGGLPLVGMSAEIVANLIGRAT